MKIALVELRVDILERSRQGLSAAIKHTIRRDRSRRTKILRALDEARMARCGLVLFPGWTVAADAPPKWLVDASKGVTVVFECLPAEERSRAKGDAGSGAFRSETYVVRDSRIVAGPFRQVGATAEQIREPQRLQWLASEIRSTRRVKVKRWESLVLVCGEANIVSGLGDGCRLDDSVGLRERELQRGLVLNPAHTPGGPQAIRDKRAWLSRNGVLVTTANAYSGGGWPSASKAAKAWVAGDRADDRLVECAAEDGMRMLTLDAG